MSREKLDRILGLVERIKSEDTDKRIQNMCNIVELCVNIVDDLQEDVLFYEDELERLRFEQEDRRLERQGINESRERNGNGRTRQRQGGARGIVDILGIG
jgi:hypothetical protein